jgi:16S rRNA (guanine527-N7)-methyltransferase
LLDIYATRLLHENRRANLTGARDRSVIYRRHFAESLALLAALEKAGAIASLLVDVGTGAGFPGLPMKIALPDLAVTLVEATGKKIRFLEALVAELDLAGVRVVQGRAEEVARVPEFREMYPLAVARTVAPLPVLLELTLPFVQVGGFLAAPKGSAAAREMREAANALTELGGEIVSAEPLDLPLDGPQPTLVLIRKARPTPDRYPRRTGIPNKRPL